MQFYSVNQKSTQRLTFICSGRLSKRERKRGLVLVKQIVTKSVFLTFVINRHTLYRCKILNKSKDGMVEVAGIFVIPRCHN
jgi:hypothetical protein